MLALKTGHQLNWGDLQYIENPMIAKLTLKSNHGARIGGEPIHNASEHNLPGPFNRTFDPYGTINQKLEHGQVFLVNSSTNNPLFTKLEITKQNTAKWAIQHSQTAFLENAVDAFMRHITVPQVHGVLRQEAKEQKAETEDEKPRRQKHKIYIDLKDSNRVLVDRYNTVLYAHNTNKDISAKRKITDLMTDGFSGVFTLQEGENFDVYVIPQFMKEVVQDLNKNKNLKHSEKENRITPSKKVSEENMADGVILHTYEHEAIEEPREEIEDVVHVTGSNELILIPKGETQIILDEENLIQDLTQPLRDALQQEAESVPENSVPVSELEGKNTSALQQAKDQTLTNLIEAKAFDKSVSGVGGLTEIKRLGGQHRTWIRSNKMKNHWRKYKMDAKDEERRKGWYSDGELDSEKLKKAIQSKLKVNFKSDIFKVESGKDHPLNQLHVELKASLDEKYKGMKDATGFDASADAQFLRFASMAGAAGEFNLSEGKIGIQAQASASFDLAKGQIKAEQVFPVNSKSQILIPYQIKGPNGIETKNVNLGHLQAKLEATLSGSAGASVMLGANVNVGTAGGLPKIKGQHTGAEGKFEAFAGVRGGCEVKGSLSWVDNLLKDSDWKQLCLIGKKVEGALGIGAEADFTFSFDKKTGRFLLRAHAGLVYGVGASGAFVLEVDPKSIVAMIHFMFDSLRKVDYRRLSLFDEKGFVAYQNVCLYIIVNGINQWEEVYDYADDFIHFMSSSITTYLNNLEQEELAYELAKKINQEGGSKEFDALLHSPPETKAILLDMLLYDPSGIWEWISDDSEKREACVRILNTVQGEREYLEILSRMNRKGGKNNSDRDKNGDRLFSFLKLSDEQRAKFETRISKRVSPAGKPAEYDPTKACKACGLEK
jgi:hypothetical protein